MAPDPQIIRLGKLDEVAENDLAKVGPIDDYRAECAVGDACCFAVLDHSAERVGSYILRVEETGEGKLEGVVVAGFARKPINVVSTILPRIEDGLRSLGCTSARFLTDRPGLIALAAKTRDIECSWKL